MTRSQFQTHCATGWRAVRLSGVLAALTIAVWGVQSLHPNQSAAFFQSLVTGPSNQVQAGTWQPPDAPLFWVEEDNSQAKISWQSSAGAVSYRVYRSTDNVSFSLIQTVATPGLSYLDTGLANHTSYYYKVTAVNLGGNESPPAGVTAKWAGPEDIVIDDAAMSSDVGNSGTVTASPGWDLYQVGLGGYAAAVLQNAAGGDGYSTGITATGQTYRWEPNSNLTGNYEVYVQYICDSSRGTANYDFYADAVKITSSPIILDQSKLDGLTGPDCGSQPASSVSGPQWVHLADIATNNQAVILQLTAPPGEAYILADAVAFRRTGDLTPAQIAAFAAPTAPGLTVTNSPTTPVEEHIRNGSFEDSSMTGWQVTGSVQNLAKDDPTQSQLVTQINPTAGNHLALIGAGTTGQKTISSLTQGFTGGVRNLGLDLKAFTTQAGKLDPTQKIELLINDHKLISVSPAELGLTACSTGEAKYCSDWRHVNFYLGDYTEPIQTLTISVENLQDDSSAQTWVAVDNVTTTDLVVNSSAVFNLTHADVLGLTTWYQLGESAQPTQGDQFQLTTQPRGNWVKYWSQNQTQERSELQQFTVRLVSGDAHARVTIDGEPFTSVVVSAVIPPEDATLTSTPSAAVATASGEVTSDSTSTSATDSAILPLQIAWHWQSASQATATVTQVASAAAQLNYQLQYQHIVDGQPVTEMLQGAVQTHAANQVTLPDLFFGTCSEGGQVCVDHQSLSQVQLSVQTVTAALTSPTSPTPATELQQATYSATVVPTD